MNKIRLDNLLVEKGLADSRNKAQSLIVTGKIKVDGQRQDKPGFQCRPDAEIDVEEKDHPYVSRGGLKLAHAIEHFGLNPANAICADIGASTGGFTEVLLGGGAAKVYAVDVGHGQLDWKLRNHPKVVVMEKTNARYLMREHIPQELDWVVCDASFISLKTVLPAALALTADKATLVALIKPQFEVGKQRVGKGGVVKDPALHKEVCDDIAHWLSGLPHWQVIGITQSPVRGPKGNIEFLVYAIKNKH